MKNTYVGLVLTLIGNMAAIAGPVQSQAAIPAPSTPAVVSGYRDADSPRNADGRFVPGDRVSDDYQQDSYVVTAWQAAGLEAPPPGYRWLRDDRGGQYLMASRTTGQIADAVDQAPHNRGPNPTTTANDAGRPPAATSGRSWIRGDRLRRDDLDAGAIVTGWKEAGLPRPARGYDWVNMNNHYLLASRRTGVIKDVR